MEHMFAWASLLAWAMSLHTSRGTLSHSIIPWGCHFLYWRMKGLTHFRCNQMIRIEMEEREAVFLVSFPSSLLWAKYHDWGRLPGLLDLMTQS